MTKGVGGKAKCDFWDKGGWGVRKPLNLQDIIKVQPLYWSGQPYKQGGQEESNWPILQHPYFRKGLEVSPSSFAMAMIQKESHDRHAPFFWMGYCWLQQLHEYVLLLMNFWIQCSQKLFKRRTSFFPQVILISIGFYSILSFNIERQKNIEIWPTLFLLNLLFGQNFGHSRDTFVS